MYRFSILANVLFGFVLINSNQVLGQDQDHLISLVRDGNSAAIQAIRTLECNYTSEVSDKNGADEYALLYEDKGRYRRSGSNIYTYRTPPNSVLEILVRDGKVWTLNSIAHNDHSASRLLSVGQYVSLSRGDVYHFALLTHWGGKDTMRCFTLNEILNKPHRIQAAKRVKESDRDLVYVQLSALRGVHEFWFDPAVNYLVRKKTWTSIDNPRFNHEENVLKFFEASQGIYFPTEIELVHHEPDITHPAIRRKITELRINHSIPPDRMRLPNIKGLNCYDGDRHVTYTVDENGTRTGPEKPEQVKSEPTKGMTQSLAPIPPSSEPISLSHWILAFSCLGLICAGIWRWRRSRRDTDE